MKTFIVRERADVIFEYIVEAKDAEDASDIVYQGSAHYHHTEWLENEVIEVVESKYADHQ